MSHHRDEDDHQRRGGVGLGAPLWTAMWFSVGLGAAYWWWSKWAVGAVQSDVISTLPAPQGPSPERARASWAGQSGEAPVEVAPPELVMAHNPPPAEAPDHPAHPTDRQIPEPPPEMLAHTPPESVGVSFKPRSGFENPTHDPESAFPHVEEGRGEAEGGAESAEAPAPKPHASVSSNAASSNAAPGAHAAVSIGAMATPKPADPGRTDGASILMASQSGEPVFDPEALATETSVAALTAGETLDETAAPLQAVGEASPAPAPKPRTRRKPGAPPEE